MKKLIPSKDVLTSLLHQRGISQDIREVNKSLSSISQITSRAADEIEFLRKALKDAAKIFEEYSKVCQETELENKRKNWIKDYKPYTYKK